MHLCVGWVGAVAVCTQQEPCGEPVRHVWRLCTKGGCIVVTWVWESGVFGEARCVFG